MKKFLYLSVASLILTLGAGAQALADDILVTVTKVSDAKAKVTPVLNSKDEGTTVPISFDSGADWSCVKDVYSVSDITAAGIKHRKVSISIGTDGTVTFHTLK